MTIPAVVSITPTDLATDASINTSVVLTFNTAVVATTVTPGSIVVYRRSTYEVIDGRYVVSGATVTFQPYKGLYEDTTYQIGVMGTDTTNPGGYVGSVDTEDSVQATQRYSFTTTTEQYATLDQVQQRADVTSDGPVRIADLTEPGGLELVGMSPRGFSCGNGVDLDEVTFTFSSELDADTITSTSVLMDAHCALGMDEYYATTGVDGTPVLQIAACTGLDYTQPTGSFTVTGTQLIWQRGASEPKFNYNTEIEFLLTQDIQDINGQGMLGDTRTIMSTEYFPKYLDARVIRLECGALVADKNDDTINRMIFKNSIEAWDQAGWNFTVTEPTPAVRRWVRNKTVIDLYDMIRAYADAHAGAKKVLADLEISYPASVKLPEGIRALAAAELEKLTRELRWYRGQGGARVASVGAYDRSRELERSRTWSIDYNTNSVFYDLCSPKIPASNLSSMRVKKLQMQGSVNLSATYIYGTTSYGTDLFAYTCPS